ncbi:MAG: ABC transporter substrate-binding protein [Oscillospiraceae bacterium]|nr:ABC transporter substrate-binding protein [Oscillospiraceae bacterium]
MQKKLLAIILTMAMLAVTTFGLTACQEKDVDNGSGQAETVPVDDNEENVPEDGEEDDEDQDVFNNDDTQAAAVAAFNELQGEVNGRTIINIYSFTTETVDDLLPMFLKANPNDFTDKFYINVEMAADHAAHRLAINTKLGENDGPDVFVADVDYAMHFAELSGTATIDEIGIEINEDDYYDYTLDLMRRKSDNAIMGLSHQATPGAMYYRADIAKEVLGVESEEEMQALVNDWDGFIDVAEKITTESDLAMIYGADELKRNFLNGRDMGWVDENDTFTIDEDTITEFVRVTQAIKDLDGLRNTGNAQWSDGWVRGMGDNEDSAFAYFGSTWYLHFVLAKNAQEGGSYGKWGMIPGPAPFYWGGTYWYASKETVTNDEEKAQAVKDIIEFFCVNEESMEGLAKEIGDFVSNKKVVDKIKDSDEFNNKLFLWETNHYQVFAEIAEDIDITRNITKHDADMDDLFTDFITNVFTNEMSISEAMAIMKEGVKADLSSITVM